MTDNNLAKLFSKSNVISLVLLSTLVLNPKSAQAITINLATGLDASNTLITTG